MLTKEKRRAERRWRSFHAWMRRLQDDWWNHGSRLNPRGVYRHMRETGVCVIKRGENWTDKYHCECFQFNLQGSYRFKDTPTGNQSEAEYRRKDGYHLQREWEERNAKDDEYVRQPGPRKRRHREGTHPYRVLCFGCGFLLGIAQVKNGDFYRGAFALRCDGCAAKEKKRRAAAEAA